MKNTEASSRNPQWHTWDWSERETLK